MTSKFQILKLIKTSYIINNYKIINKNEVLTIHLKFDIYIIKYFHFFVYH
jgi:hypothetical protein